MLACGWHRGREASLQTHEIPLVPSVHSLQIYFKCHIDMFKTKVCHVLNVCLELCLFRCQLNFEKFSFEFKIIIRPVSSFKEYFFSFLKKHTYLNPLNSVNQHVTIERAQYKFKWYCTEEGKIWMCRCLVKTIKHFCHPEILYLLMTDI